MFSLVPRYGDHKAEAKSVDYFFSGVAQATALPQGGELITPEQTQERMRNAFDRASSFLRLTALLSALTPGGDDEKMVRAALASLKAP